MALISERVDAAREGSNPKVICRLQTGWVVIGDVRGLKVLRRMPVWFYDWQNAVSYSEHEHGALRNRLRLAIEIGA